MQTLPDLLTHYLRASATSQKRLAEDLGYDPAVISRLFKGQRTTSPAQRHKLLSIISWFYDHGVLRSLEEANILLMTANVASLNANDISIFPRLKELASDSSILSDASNKNNLYRSSLLPPHPRFVFGRDGFIETIKNRIITRLASDYKSHSVYAIYGWPGVGKSTIVSSIAYNKELLRYFGDGVLWASLGPNPNVLAELQMWARTIGLSQEHQGNTIEELSAQISAQLQYQRRLLIVDDVWSTEVLRPFQIGGSECVLLFTTRLPRVAQESCIIPQNIYQLEVLSEEDAFNLLGIITPSTVAINPEASLQLVKTLENLPLAVQIAGRLLNAEINYGFGIEELLKELHDGAKILEAVSPSDMAQIEGDRLYSPTVQALLRKSTDRLDEYTRQCFAYLGVFAAKPATFDIRALEAIWDTHDSIPTIRKLIDFGLLEPVEKKRYWLHSLLVAHARTLLQDDD